MATTLSRSIAQLLTRLGTNLDPQLRAESCLRIADSVGIAIGATRSGNTANQVLAGSIDGSAGGACGVFGQPRGEAPATAAFANSALVHVLDYDDIHDAARLHPTTVTLPAAMAAAQLVKADGAKVVDAVLLGDELTCRLGVACSPKGTGPGSDWFLTQLFGYFGAAYAAGHVLGFTEDQFVSAFGLAYMQAAGGKQAGFGVGSNARAIYPAFAAQGGVQAALLARAGMQGPEGSFDGAAGLLPVYLGAQATPAQTALLLHESNWETSRIELKPWPCCRLSHPYVAAAIALRTAAAGAKPLRVEVHVNASAAKLCRPLAQRRWPATLQDAKYSIPWMTAFALVHGHVGLDNLSEAALQDGQVLAVAQDIEILETLPDNPGHPLARIRMHIDGGSLDSPPDVQVPTLDAAAAQAKFTDCLAHAGRAAPAADQLWNRLLGLQAEPSVDFLFEQQT